MPHTTSFGISTRFQVLSPGLRQVTYVLLTLPPLPQVLPPKAFDLHASSTPSAFNLNQDQILSYLLNFLTGPFQIRVPVSRNFYASLYSSLFLLSNSCKLAVCFSSSRLFHLLKTCITIARQPIYQQPFCKNKKNMPSKLI